jgi:hypothetical protein
MDRDHMQTWSRFQPWTDMRARAVGLAVSLDEKDFMRRLVTGHLHTFPFGLESCPLCNMEAFLVDERHLVFTCPTLVKLRNVLADTINARGWSSTAMMLDAWVGE